VMCNHRRSFGSVCVVLCAAESLGRSESVCIGLHCAETLEAYHPRSCITHPRNSNNALSKRTRRRASAKLENQGEKVALARNTTVTRLI
jgi:hypothetical protein